MHIAGFSSVIGIRSTDPIQSIRPLAGNRFDNIIAALSAWMIFGLYLDGWAHSHFKIETFFTPWHAILYSGFLALASFLFITLVSNRARGYVWQRAMPVGYGLSVIGAAIFLAGGVGDVVWHNLFGFERDVQALVSPTHLSLAVGGTLMSAGPLRAAWYRQPTDTCNIRWPALSSLGLLLLILTFFTQIAHPFSMPWLFKADPVAYSSPREHSPQQSNNQAMAEEHRGPDTNAQASRQDNSQHGAHRQTATASPQARDARHTQFLYEALGLAAILLQSFILMGPLLFAVVFCELPVFGLTVLLTTHTALMITQTSQTQPVLVMAGLLTGLLGDLFRVRWGFPDPAKAPLRIFAFVLPSVLFGLFFFFLLLSQGVGWSIHLWLGSVVMAGVVGLLTSYLLVPPARIEHR